MSKMAVPELISCSRCSAKKEFPSMAERKIDSTWLKRSSYGGWCASIRTCRWKIRMEFICF